MAKGGFGAYGLRSPGLALAFRFLRVQGLGFWVLGLGLRVKFRV